MSGVRGGAVLVGHHPVAGGLERVALVPVRPAVAGGQLEEPLAASVRSALSAAIAEAPPPQPEFVDTQAKIGYLRWLGTMSDRLRSRLPDWQTRIDFLGTAWYEAKRAGLEPALCWAWCRPKAHSAATR